MPHKPTLSLLLMAAALGLAACERAGTQAQPPQGQAPAAPLPAAPAAAEGAAKDAKDEGEVLAVVNGRPITRAMLEAYGMERRSPTGGPLPEKRLLDELIAQELLVQQAEKAGLAQRPEVRRRLELQRRNVLAMTMLREEIGRQPVTDKELRKLYDELVAKQPRKEYKARHILVKDEKTARELIARLDKGADFAELARKHSIGPSGKQGGELGWFSPSQMVKPFADAVAALEKGAYTKTPVQTRFGWHVVQLEDVRELPAPEFEQVKDRLREALQRRRVQQYLERLVQEAKIERRMAAAPAPAPQAGAVPQSQAAAGAADGK